MAVETPSLEELVKLLEKRVTTLEKLVKGMSHDIAEVDHRTTGMIRLGPSHHDIDALG